VTANDVRSWRKLDGALAAAVRIPFCQQKKAGRAGGPRRETGSKLGQNGAYGRGMSCPRTSLSPCQLAQRTFSHCAMSMRRPLTTSNRKAL